MAQSVLDICNMALDYCNTRNITSIDESTKENIYTLVMKFRDYANKLSKEDIMSLFE